MADFVKVAKLSDIASGESKLVEVNGQRIALFNLDGSYYALDDACTHKGGPLSGGPVQGEKVVCPWHGAIFDIKTGAAAGPPASRPVAKYNVRLQGDDVEVEA